MSHDIQNKANLKIRLVALVKKTLWIRADLRQLFGDGQMASREQGFTSFYETDQ